MATRAKRKSARKKRPAPHWSTALRAIHACPGRVKFFRQFKSPRVALKHTIGVDLEWICRQGGFDHGKFGHACAGYDDSMADRRLSAMRWWMAVGRKLIGSRRKML